MIKKLLLLLLLAAVPALAQLKPGTPGTTAASLTGGPITIDGGSNTAPAYSFTGDENTGFYRTGAESLGLTTAGTLRLTVNESAVISTLPLQTAAGTVSVPAYSFTDDVDGTGTGIYRSAADALSIANNGVLTVTLNASGNTDFQDGNIVTTGTFGSGAITTTGVVLGPNGTNSAPTYSFTSETNTGMFNGTGILVLAVGGVDILSLDGTNFTVDNTTLFEFGSATLRLGDGTAAGASYTFTTDTDMGMHREGADSLGFSANGLLQMTIDVNQVDFESNNIVGAGTIGGGAITSTGTSSFGESSFSGTVNVSDGVVGSPGIQSTSDDDATGTGLYWSAADALSIANNGVLTVTFDASGNTDFQNGNITTTGTFGSGAITSTGTSSFGQSSFSDTVNVSNQFQVGTGIAYANADALMASAAVQVGFDETDGAADNRMWDLEIEGGQFRWRLIDDAISAATNWLTVDRTANTVDSVGFPGSTVVFSDGAVGNPVIQFSNDNDGTGTGFYRSAADALSLANNGVLTVTYNASGNTDFQNGNIVTTGTFGSGAITATGVYLGPDGVVGAPTYSFSSETNTGMYLPAAGSLRIVVGGGDRLTFSTVLATFEVSIDMDNNNINSVNDLLDVDVLNLENTSGLTLAAGVITVDQTYHGVTAEGAQTLDSLVTINSGLEGDILILTATDTDDIFIDVDGGNINGTDRTLNGTGDIWMAIFDGTNWTEISFSDND